MVTIEVTDSDDEFEPQNSALGSCSNLMVPGQGPFTCRAEGDTSNPARSKMIWHFTEMGFPENLVAKAIDENGEGNTEVVLETLLTYSALEESRPQYEVDPSAEFQSLEFKWNTEDLSDAEFSFTDEENSEHPSGEDEKKLHLVDMGFSVDEVSSAMEENPNTSISELMDYIYAARMEQTSNDYQQEPAHMISSNDDKSGCGDDEANQPNVNKRKLFEEEEKWESKIGTWRRNQKVTREKRKKPRLDDDKEEVCLPKVMVGFGLPNGKKTVFKRTIPNAAIGPPYFYYENVACTPKGVWSTISRFLHNIKPEFVDSKHFCAAARKRGYIHNLPIDNRFPLMPIPPQTIQEALPLTKRWWPSWDSRTKLNCLNTCTASAKNTERIRKALECWQGTPPQKTQKYVLYECRKWNLVWTGKNKVAPLDPEEIEMLLGYPKFHTRGGGTSRTERFKALGNSFQVDTVAYQLSVLKDMFPGGISVLSLFSGIGGAEVALHRLRIPLKNVVAVESSEVNRNILRSWWEGTEQKGNLIDDITDVQQLTAEKLEKLIESIGGFDLIIGGSPCNNLTGSNRVSRDGLQGKHSVLFFEFFRILDTVKCLMGS